MENRQLITRPERVPTFKSKDLNTATKALYEVAENVYTTAMEGNKQICIILARVERNKAYKEDGFKSLVDYCGAIGFDKSKVHKMENAGRLYDSENKIVKTFAESMGYGNLAVIASASEDDIAKAVEAGELSSDSSQDDIRTWKTAYNAKTTKEKVLPKFEVFGVYGTGDTFHYDSIELENVVEISSAVKVGSFEMTFEDGKAPQKWTVYADETSGNMLRLRYEKAPKAKKEKPAVKSIKKMTKEELLAALAALEEEEEA